MPALNLFTQAKVAPAKAPKSAKPKKAVVETEGLRQYLALDVLEKEIKTLKTTLRPRLDTQFVEVYAKRAALAHEVPESFRGSDGDAEATIVLSKRNTRSALQPTEVELLEAYDIPVGTETDVAETYIINPAYKDDTALLEKVSTAMQKVKDLPADFLLHQTATSRRVVTEDTQKAVCALTKPQIEKAMKKLGLDPKKAPEVESIIKQLLPMVSMLSIKGSKWDGDTEEAMNEVVKMTLGEEYAITSEEG